MHITKNWPLVLLRIGGVTLVVTGVAKLVTSNSGAPLLALRDPIFGIPNLTLMFGLGVLECTIGVYCWAGTNLARQAVVMLWMGTMFLAYRTGLWWIDWQKPCTCLGNVADAIGLSDHAADSLMKFLLGYLILSGALALAFVARSRRNLNRLERETFFRVAN